MRRLLLPLVVSTTSGDVVRSLSTSLPLWCTSSTSARSTHSSHAVAFTDEEMVDEEHLARLLVQNTPMFTAVSPSRAGDGKPITSSQVSSAINETTVSSAEEEQEEEEEKAVGISNNKTLMGSIPTANDAVNIPRSGTAVTHSRRENDYYAKYSHVRRVQHTKMGKAENEMEQEGSIEWMCCGCRTYNFIGRKSCRRCKQKDVESFKHNFPPARHIPLFPTVWTCHSCGHANRCDQTNSNNRRKFYCGNCGVYFSGLREWYCPSCNHVNSRGSTQCATCYEARPHVWTCSECKEDKNSIFYTECRNCRSSRQRLVSDSTVLCSTCHQRNDVQWEMCFVCMTPLGMMRSVKKLQEKSGVTITESTESISTVANAEDVVEKAKMKENNVVNNVLKEVGQDQNNQQEQQQQQQQQQEEEDLKQREQNKENMNTTSSSSTTTTTTTTQVKEKKQEVSDDGSWWCMECQVLHRRNVAFCDICLKPKTLVDSKSEETPSNHSKLNSSSTTWTCSACSHCNEDISDIICKKCQKPRQQDHKEEVQKGQKEKESLQGNSHKTSEVVVNTLNPIISSSSSSLCNTGDWRCPYCRNMINVMITSCCGVPREVPFGYWLCPTCCSTNRDERGKCIGCSAAPPEKPWRCLLCRNKNHNDAFFCTRCGSAHPHHWKCEKCGVRCLHACDKRCRSCGSVKPTIDLIACQNCCADNHPSRKSCFRCRARLSSDSWNCKACGSHGNEKHLRRCTSCGEARVYNMDEVTWICDVCNTAVYSGGDLPVRTQCPRCNSDRTSRSVCVPSRWKCRRCGLTNLYNAATCMECESKRVLVGLQTHTTCPTCFRLTSLTVEERCEHCGSDLAQVINMCGSAISLETFTAPLTVTESTVVSGSNTKDDTFALTNKVLSSSSSTTTIATASAVAASSLLYNNMAKESSTIASQTESRKTTVLSDHNEGYVGLVNNNDNDLGISSSRTRSTSEFMESCTLTNGNSAYNDEEFKIKHEEESLNNEFNINSEDIHHDDDDISDVEDDIEGFDAGEWSGDIPSWMCGNCEATNLEEAEICVDCGLRRADE
ncbi:uncharacterized protein TM35_000023880 [Trypanosoma theileri]|uniref:RanBP2-type domain-containing protein n=1 Tax=Trypanosoma theileri TaxID=67003 RepID=A0A1X0P808_9TRYP|nr:uncharacterized protein TM35_000023880 [Trypanosoma theileri]ORC93062.1 hypothetical protein TM35_000023880 [Trypanosoma theileri]